MLSHLGILGLIDDDEALRDMWINLRKDNDPTLMANFEEFLAKLSRDLHRQEIEKVLFGIYQNGILLPCIIFCIRIMFHDI